MKLYDKHFSSMDVNPGSYFEIRRHYFGNWPHFKISTRFISSVFAIVPKLQFADLLDVYH